MHSPDPARPVSIKQEEPEEKPDLNILHMVVSEEEQDQSPSSLPRDEKVSPHIKDEKDELLIGPEEPDGSLLTLLVGAKKDEDVSSFSSEIAVERDSGSEVTEDSDEWEESGRSFPLYSCKLCAESFSSSRDLRKHQSVHAGEIRFNCRFCSKNFSRLTHLKQHTVALHTGERPFHCEHCGERFSQNEALKAHQRSHAGERPFHCEHCDKSFIQSVDLRKHQRRAHIRERPFHCEHCDKRFSLKATLKTHQLIHTGERPFHCEHCDKRFRQLAHLKQHQSVHT